MSTNGRYAEATNANRAAEEIALAAGHTRIAATTQNNQGIGYLIRGLLTQAPKMFQAALDLVRNSQPSDQYAFLTLLTSNIASAYLELGEFESADALLQTTIASEHYDPNNPINLLDEVILARASLALGRPEEGHQRLSYWNGHLFRTCSLPSS